MTCLEAQGLLAGQIAGALDEPPRAALKGHLASCGACRDTEARLRAVWEALGTLEIPPPPLHLAERLKAATPAALPEPVSEPPAPMPRWPAALALALAALAAGGWLWKDRLLPAAPPPAPAAPPEPPAPPPVPWANRDPDPLRLLTVRGAELWAAPGSSGAVDEASGRLLLGEGTVWGRPLAGEKLSFEAAGWRATVTRGTFTASVSGAVAALTCHEGFVRLESGPGYATGPMAVTDGHCVLLVPGRAPVGPRRARSPYPGEPGATGKGEAWWKQLGRR